MATGTVRVPTTSSPFAVYALVRAAVPNATFASRCSSSSIVTVPVAPAVSRV